MYITVDLVINSSTFHHHPNRLNYRWSVSYKNDMSQKNPISSAFDSLHTFLERVTALAHIEGQNKMKQIRAIKWSDCVSLLFVLKIPSVNVCEITRLSLSRLLRRLVANSGPVRLADRPLVPCPLHRHGWYYDSSGSRRAPYSIHIFSVDMDSDVCDLAEKKRKKWTGPMWNAQRAINIACHGGVVVVMER